MKITKHLIDRHADLCARLICEEFADSNVQSRKKLKEIAFKVAVQCMTSMMLEMLFPVARVGKFTGRKA
jgi:hypothetical protein